MKRTQIGWISIVIIAILNCFLLFQKQDISTVKIAVGITILILLLFYKLTIKIDEESVGFSLGIGLIRGKYQFSEIEYCRPISYFPIGFGIRFRPGVILYNVSGTKAIELSIKGKSRKIWIGTDDPDAVSEKINSYIHREHEPTDYTIGKRQNTKPRNTFLLITSVIAIVILFTVYGNRDAEITLRQTDFKISGLYGSKISYADIAQIDTVVKPPKIEMKTNGYAFGKVCKGNFRLSEIGNAKLFINFNQPPFIQINLKNDKIYFINFKNRRQTIELFEELRKKVE